MLALLAGAGCSTHSETAPPTPGTSVPGASPTTSTTPTVHPPRASSTARPSVDATSACVQFARAAGDVDTATSTLGQTRQTAARAYGTPQLQALYDGAGEGRNREQDTWRQHHARVTVTAVPDADPLDELDGDTAGTSPGAAAPRPGTPVTVTVTVTVTGTAHGTDGWTAPTAAYRLDCLTVHDPVAGWLVDDVAVSTFMPAAG